MMMKLSDFYGNRPQNAQLRILAWHLGIRTNNAIASQWHDCELDDALIGPDSVLIKLIRRRPISFNRRTDKIVVEDVIQTWTKTPENTWAKDAEIASVREQIVACHYDSDFEKFLDRLGKSEE